jgi:transcription elongation factor GreB
VARAWHPAQVSKAFSSEETPDEPLLVPRRPPLPEGSPNYVTQRGLDALHAELARLEGERPQVDAIAREEDRARALSSLQARLQELDERITSAELVDTSTHPANEIRFGAHVTVRGEDEQQRAFEIVGVDEADVAHGRVAFAAPLARALLGKRVGDAVTLRTPRGEEELEILAVDYHVT